MSSLTLMQQLRACWDKVPETPGTPEELLARIGNNEVYLWTGPGWSCSGEILEPGVLHVCHFYGNLQIADFIAALMPALGVERIEWIGRRGWHKALERLADTRAETQERMR